VAYLGLAADDARALIDDAQKQTLVWADPLRGSSQATMPLIVFTR